MSHPRTGFAIALSAAAAASAASHAVEIEAGDWTFEMTGNVNAHYILAQCEDSPADVDGGLSCVALGDAEETSSSVSNGLLPAALGLSVSTTQNGFDIAATFGFYPGISTNDGGSPNLQDGGGVISPNTALGTTGLDVRQVFLTFGNERMGTVLAGRNIGLFGADAILGDMTLHGVGAGGSNAAPANTSFGSIGLGYIYTDWLAQINYTTPDFYGAKLTIGIFDPLEPAGPISTPKSAPGFHGKAAWTSEDERFYVSATFLHQQQEGLTDAGDFESTAFDIGGKVTWGDAEFLGFYYDGSGVGTTALFFGATDGLGDERDSDGFLAQATYTWNQTKFGVNYGESNLDTADAEINPTLVSKNSKYTLGVYHLLTENLTLVGEFTDMESEAQNGASNDSMIFNVGAFLAF